MKPTELGKKYDKIARWWHNQHFDSSYGVSQIQRAVKFAGQGGKALDVGCGAGGRLVRILQRGGFSVTGIDVSNEMVKLASANHPGQKFIQQDICSWQTDEKFNVIVAWDSIFHLPLAMHRPVLRKLCQLLEKRGILIYSFGNAEGESTDQWRNDTFYYSSIGINENIKVLLDNGLSILHFELDQYPEKHAYIIATMP